MIVLRQNITIGICISNPTSQCGYLLKILYRNAKLCFINVVHIRSPNSTFRSYGKERPVPKVMFMRMTEILTNTTAFCRLKGGCGAGWGEECHSIFGIREFLSGEKMSHKNDVCLNFFICILIYEKI